MVASVLHYPKSKFVFDYHKTIILNCDLENAQYLDMKSQVRKGGLSEKLKSGLFLEM